MNLRDNLIAIFKSDSMVSIDRSSSPSGIYHNAESRDEAGKKRIPVKLDSSKSKITNSNLVTMASTVSPALERSTKEQNRLLKQMRSV